MTAASGSVLVAITGWDPEPWFAAFRAAAPDRVFVDAGTAADDPDIHYAVVWRQPPGSLSRLPNLKAIFSLGAGVDHAVNDPTLPDVPLVRIVSSDLTMRMREYVAWRVLDHFRQGSAYRSQQAVRLWHELPQPAATAVTIGIVGMGVLGSDCAHCLRAIGFNVAGWSRTPKSIEGVESFSGSDGLIRLLGKSDIVVVLLPLTSETRGILNCDFIGAMKRRTPIGGPVLINAGRGGLQNEQDIVEALDSGRLMAASLDVFEIEPLAEDSPLWSHPAVTVTPHAAASSEPEALVPDVVRQIENFERGLPLTGIVDREVGY